LIYSTEKTLKDAAEKVNESLKSEINENISQLRNAVKEENVEEMKAGIEKLTNSSHRLAEEIYKQSSTQQEQQTYSDTSSDQQAEDTQGDAKEGEQVFDAEYKEEDGDNSK